MLRAFFERNVNVVAGAMSVATGVSYFVTSDPVAGWLMMILTLLVLWDTAPALL